MVPDQNVYWLVRSQEKSKLRRRPVAAAMPRPSPSPMPAGQAEHRRGDHREQADDDQHHDLDVGPGHRLDAAEHRVDHGRHGDRQRRGGEVPAEHERQHDRRRRDDGADRHPARQQEQQAGEAAGLPVETALEVLVGGVDARPVEERDEGDRQDDHRHRQGVVELDEAHAVVVALPGRADHRDRAELRRHHRDPGGPPRDAAVGEEVAFDLVAVLGPLQPVEHNPGGEADEDGPVDPVHAGRDASRGTRAAATRARPARASQMTTTRT